MKKRLQEARGEHYYPSFNLFLLATSGALLSLVSPCRWERKGKPLRFVSHVTKLVLIVFNKVSLSFVGLMGPGFLPLIIQIMYV